MPQQQQIPALYMRGGTSKGVFFKQDDLVQFPTSAERDNALLRVIGSPDPYAKHTDGMGGATSSTSKVVILAKSSQPGHHVDYTFGQVAIDKPFVDWGGNCGNLTAAVGVAAVKLGLIDVNDLPSNGRFLVRVWQINIKKTIEVEVTLEEQQVLELGDFELDGVTFPAQEIPVHFVAPIAADESVFPTGKVQESMQFDDLGEFPVTYINAGIPTIFMPAEVLGFTGAELQNDINGDAELLAKLERIRAQGGVNMGLFDQINKAQASQHVPKLAFVAPALDYIASSGKSVDADTIDVSVRAMSMGKLHHAMMGTAAVAIATAAAIPGTLVSERCRQGASDKCCFGHPSGSMSVGATVKLADQGQWLVEKVSMSRSARTLMQGSVCIPK